MGTVRPISDTAEIAISYEFVTREEAIAQQDTLWEEAKADAIKRGCQLDGNGYIIGVNAESGAPMPDAQRTTKWADVGSVDGKFYVQKKSEKTIEVITEL